MASLIDLELPKYPGLTGQQVPEFCLFLPPQYRVTCVCYHTQLLKVNSRDRTHTLVFAPQTLKQLNAWHTVLLNKGLLNKLVNK